MADPNDTPQAQDYSGVQLDMSKSQPLSAAPAGVTLDLSKSKPLPDTNPAAQPGAIQTRKGGPVQNVNTMPPPTREDQVNQAQSAISSASSLPGQSIVAGVAKGAYQTGIGANQLLAKAEHAVGIPLTEEQERLRQGDVSPFTEAMSKGANVGEKAGEAGEELAEWAAGDEALKGAVKSLGLVQKIAQHAPHLIELAEDYPKATKFLASLVKGGTVGGAEGAVKTGSAEGAKEGAEGGAIGGVAGEIVGPVVKKVAKAVGLGNTAEEEIMKAAQPYKKNFKFIEDWGKAKDRIVQEVEENGKFKDMGEAADRIGDVRRKIWTDEVMPAIDRHATETFDTTKAADAVRAKITPALQKNFPEDAKVLQQVADRYTSGSPLFTGEKTVGDVEKEIELYNAKLSDKGYWKKTPKERAMMEKADPQISAWRTLSDELRSSLYEHLEKNPLPGDPSNIKELKDTYGAIGNVENEIRGQVNVAGRARNLSLKQIIGLTAGFAHGGPGGIAIAALPIIDKLYNEPTAMLNRAVSKAAPAGPVKKAAQAVAGAASKALENAPAAAGSAIVRVRTSDGTTREINSDQLPEAQKIDPGLKVVP
jgi:hypothetical protein